MKSIQDQVLDLFKDEISTRLDKNWKEIPLELDYDLFDAPGDDLHEALNKLLPTPLTVEEWVNQVNLVTAEQIVSVAKKIKEDTIFFLTGKEVTE